MFGLWGAICAVGIYLAVLSVSDSIYKKFIDK